MLPTPTRHLQIQFQQIADASDPDQASANPIPASCRCFQRPEFTPICICKSNSNKLQMLPTPGYVSANSYPTNCRCFRPRPGIYKSNSSKLQMLPTPARHLQIQFQQVADASNARSSPLCASANPIPASCRCFQPQDYVSANPYSNKLQMLPTPTRHLQIQFQQIADASDPDQASVAPKTTNQRCPPVNFLLKFAGGHLYCISISSNSYICLFLIHRGLSRPVSWHLFWDIPCFS